MKITKKIGFVIDTKIIYNIKKSFLIIIKPYLLKKYEITELPFCLEGIAIKDWAEELNFQWVIENEEELEEI